ncbi:MAG: gfo/Idh/MocA family oxidoreductase [Planctomycetaceae bacterium]|nr:gfo/Idh/MocA family oxidoreductase [Planctomycetaceae bacterium]
MSNPVNRRTFIAGSAAAGAAMSLPAASYAKIKAANEKVRVAFLGVGGRCQQHIDVILKMKELGKPVEPVAVCDVWDGQVVPNVIKGRGLYPSAERCGLKLDDKDHVTKDYRKIIGAKDVDAVCIATPDHWHARMAIDALENGKDVYMEKPMTRTIPEAIAVVDAAAKNNRVVTVGVQSMADPTWQAAYEYIKTGNIGHVLQGQTSYFRNSSVGQWRYYPLTKEMSPKTIDWDMWLGHGIKGVDGEPLGPTPKEVPFDRAVWAQWRCYWPFGGGMFTDLFVHQTTHLIAAMGVRFPARVVGSGGIYMEYDTRDVPDTATVVADYDEGCQFIVSATMCNDVQLGEMIRGHLATIKFTGGGDYMKGFEVYGQSVAGGPAKPKSDNGQEKPVHTFLNPALANAKPGVENSATYALWANFLECVAKKNRQTLSTPELGAAAFSTVNMGVQSYRQGKVLFWDKEKRVVKQADASWATQWEARSKKRGKPNQIIGWEGGDKGSLLTPPAYQKLEGPWINGQEPMGS